MRSPFSRIGESARDRSGFTLLEVLIVVLLAGMIAAIALTAITRQSVTAARREAVSRLVAELSLARIDAMRSGKPVTLRAELTEDSLIARHGEREKSWKVKGLAMHEGDSSPVKGLEAVFEASGRTRAREWRFRDADAAVAAAPDTLWRIDFDPISGAARLGRGAAAPIMEVVR